jgi:hypothetical protein
MQNQKIIVKLVKLNVPFLVDKLRTCATPTSINYSPLVTTHMNPPNHSDYSIDVYNIRARARHLSTIERHYRVLA